MEIFKNFSTTDLVDIGVITLLIYAVLVWFKRTSARFVIMGILILCGVYLGARYLELYLTTAVFQAFFAVFFLALVIIFQEELRHFFERLALWGTLRGRRKLTGMSPLVDVLVRTVANLSQKRVGALIVVRGKDPLDRHLEGGMLLHGNPSEQLLESIFDPHSSGHDGATIIEDNLVQKFGCHLPLSKDLKQTADYGTRHTAALGLAERCDALCAVVSEERGSISIAREGKIYPVLSLAQLHDSLEKFYLEKFPPRKGRLGMGWLTSNFKERVLAVVLACAVWGLFGQRTESIRRDFNIPIEYRNVDPMLVLNESETKEVMVTLSGLERAFDLLESKSLKVSLDLSQIRPGLQTVIIRRQDLVVPANLNLERVEPSILRLSVDQLIQMKVRVEARFTGPLPPALRLKKVTLTPEQVAVILTPEDRKETIKIYTEPIDLSQIKETTSLTPMLVVPSHLRFPDDKVPTVKVTVEVEKEEPPKPLSKPDVNAGLRAVGEQKVLVSPKAPSKKVKVAHEKFAR